MRLHHRHDRVVEDIKLNEMVSRLEEDRSDSIGRNIIDVWLRYRSC